ncbi:Pleckstrin domain [Trinorchestia longiramus]|nr:Pleckstrin domain [Trinorchestia longiramus]
MNSLKTCSRTPSDLACQVSASTIEFEAAWDSSLHNSLLLNRVTPHGETIYMTVSAYLQLGNCVQPLTITKDLCLVLYGRDSRAMPRSLRSLFLGAYKYGPEANRITGVYEACLKRASEAGLQRRQRRVLDTSSTYVRGEENLHGWRPRGDSLIFEHQWELEKIQRLAEVEGTRHRILLASKLGADAPCNTKPATSVVAHHHDYTKSEKEVANLAAKAAQSSPVRMPSLTSTGSADSDNLTEAQKQMLLKYVRLMQGRPLVEPPPPEAPVTPSDEKDTDSTQLSQPRLCEPVQVTPPVEQDEQIPLGGSASLQQHEQKQQQQQQARESPLPSPDDSSRTSSPLDMQGPQFVCEVEEVRISPVVSRKGYLNVLDNRTNTWVKRWVVVRRPYVFIFRDERDPLERGLINLMTAEIEYSEHQEAMLKVPNSFRVMTKERGYLLQTLSDRDMQDWLYAINPLLAGQIRSKLGRRSRHTSGSNSQPMPTLSLPSGAIISN